jgi:hypothetical protein
MSPLSSPTALLAALACATPAVAQVTWTVDDSGGADFVQIQDAIDAAADGDVILVEPGDYASFAIVDKGLVLTGTTPTAMVRVSSHSEVRDLAAGKLVELTGFRFGEPALIGGAAALVVQDCTGSVRASSCVMTGWDPVANHCPPQGTYTYPCAYYYSGCTDTSAMPGAEVRNSVDTVFFQCTLRGGRGSWHTEYHCAVATPGAPGILLDGGDATLLACVSEGGLGGGYGPVSLHCADGEAGGDGVHARNGSTVFLHGGQHRGRPGGGFDCDPSGTCCGVPGVDGDGLHVDASSSGAWLAGQITPGIGGAGTVTASRTTPYCIGTWAACPCGNAGLGLAGCDNAHGTGGARLVASGTPSVSADTLRLEVTGLAPTGAPAAIFVQSIQLQFGATLGDGLLCVGGTVVRLAGRLAANGTVSLGHGNAGDPPLSVLSGVPAGATRYYQVWYRSQPAFCTPSPSNLSNGMLVSWDD